ncbi:MAG: flagellar hook-basal body complex protein FliE [Oscillospiraceae bacterium]|nr:flagellar hook-basal body complex protein FliE [Oscillospiraceae bacterium]
MNIIPVSSNSAITPFQSAFPAAAKTKEPTTFQSMFEDAVSNIENLNSIKDQDSFDLALGNLDDIGAMQVNSQKAEVALQLFVQMRNRIIESYQEILRINV